VRQRNRGRTRLHQGQSLAANALNVRVNDVDSGSWRTCQVRLAEAITDQMAAYEAVAVPLGLARTKIDAMHHALSEKPVVSRGVRDFDGVWSIADKPTDKVFRNPARHGQIKRRDLFNHRTVRADQIVVADLCCKRRPKTGVSTVFGSERNRPQGYERGGWWGCHGFSLR